MRIVSISLITWVLSLLSMNAHAVLISTSPANQTVSSGANVSVSLDISGLGAGGAPSLGAYDLDIVFDATVLGFNSVVFGDPGQGNQLDLAGFGSINGAGPAGGNLNLFELSLDTVFDLDNFQLADFSLATLSFSALSTGTSVVGILVNAVADAQGNALNIDTLGGSVTVAAVDEPATWLLLLMAGSALILRRGISVKA